MNIIADLLNSSGFQAVLNLIENILKIIRWVVPIGLIVMTGVDIFKKVINPNEKEGQKKIMYRIVAAIVIYFIPYLSNILMGLVDIGKNGYSKSGTDGGSEVINNGSSIDILYCPNSNTKIKVGSSLSLSTTASNDYKGTIEWMKNIDDEYVIITPKNSGQQLDYTIKKYPPNGNFSIMLKDNSDLKQCKINVEQDNIDTNIAILDCPKNDKIFNIGDEIVLTADVVKDYNGALKWSSPATKSINIKQDSTGKKASIRIINYDAKGYEFIVLSNGVKSATCKIDIRSKAIVTGNIDISGCPNNKVKKGQSFSIIANDNSKVHFSGAIFSNFYELTDNQNNTASVKIINHYSDYFSMSIHVVSDDGKEGWCNIYTYE